MELKGSRTERNLREAFAGETQARSKYDYFASMAKKEGYEQIAAIFQARPPPTTKRSTPRCSRPRRHRHHGGESGLLPPPERTMSGRICGDRMAQEAGEEGFTELAEKFWQVGRIREGPRALSGAAEQREMQRVFEKSERPCGSAATAAIWSSEEGPEVGPCVRPSSEPFRGKENY